MLARVSLSIFIFLLFFSIYVFTMEGRVRFGDEGERYLTAQSLVERHDLAIRIQPDLHQKTGTDGRNYSSYELGSILPLAPLYALGSAVSKLVSTPDPNSIEMLFVGLVNPMVTALTVVVLFRFSLDMYRSDRVAFVLAALYGVSTIAWPYSKAFEREPILTLFLIVSTYFSYKFRLYPNSRWLCLAALSLGFLVFAKIANVIFVPLFGIYLASALYSHESTRSRSRWVLNLAIFTMPIGLLVALQAFLNQARFGSFFDIGLAGTWGDPLSYFGFTLLREALSGLLFSPEKSIFVFSPPLLLLVPAWILFFKKNILDATFIGSLIVVSILFNAMNANWAQSSWWGPKYLVPVAPLGVFLLGALLTQEDRLWKRVWYVLAILLGVAGIAIQIVGVSVDDRGFLDITGEGITPINAINFVQHGAIESLLVYLSPTNFPIEVNCFGLLLIALIIFFGIWLILQTGRDDKRQLSSFRHGFATLALALAITFAGFMFWVILPYSDTLSSQANTKYVAGNNFLKDGESCKANQMYLLALQGGTDFEKDATLRLNQALAVGDKNVLSADDLMEEIEVENGAQVEEDATVTLSGNGSIKISATVKRDVTVTTISRSLPVEPSSVYRLSGWTKLLNVYGSGYAVVTIYEDDGNWRKSRSTDIKTVDQTVGWQPFWGTITTLPTTRRLILKMGLWKTFGTVWIDDVRLEQLDPRATMALDPFPRCKSRE